MSLTDTTTKKTKKQSRGWFAELMSTIVYPLVTVVAVYSLLFQPFRIPSASMVDTLEIGDFVWVTKFSYGYSKHSVPFSPDLFDGRIWSAEPKQGDVAVFKWPGDNSTDYIKRVIGLPGDRVQVIAGVLHINGLAVKREFIADMDFQYYDPRLSGQARFLGKKYRETLPSGVSHFILEATDSGRADNTAEITVPAGAYFMMGDNRDNSEDSRVWGTVPFENMVGRADRIFPSWDGGVGEWYEFWTWPMSIRWERLFQSIE